MKFLKMAAAAAYAAIKGRVSRRTFDTAFIMALILLFAADLLPGFLGVPLVMVTAVAVAIAAVGRAHDLGHSALWCLWLFAPLIKVVFLAILLFKAGEEKENGWGEPVTAKAE